jgi:hypothetical protein
VSLHKAVAWALVMCLVGGGLTWAAWSAGEDRGYYRGVQYAALSAQPAPTPTPPGYSDRMLDCARMPTDTGVKLCYETVRDGLRR